jgi:ABC-type nitrate/sulfonate/bicarbonate transport system substrate-binding protein
MAGGYGKVMTNWRLAAVGLLLLLLVTGCRSEEETGMTFMAGFRPQANLPFVGVYVAQEKGFFEEEGLTVSVQHSAGGGEHLQLLAAGEVHVTTQDAAVLLQRRADPGLPLVSIGLVGQRGQQAYVALAGNGMQTPADWRGRTVGFKGTPPPDVFAILDAVGLREADVQLVNVGFDPRMLTEGVVDVYPVYKSNEPHMIGGWGYELVQWQAEDFGVPTLGLAYVTTDDLVAEEPEMLGAFMRGALRGIAYAESNREEAVAITMQYVGEDADAAHMRFMLDTEFEDYRSPVTDAHGDAWQTVEQWQALADMLWMHGALAEGVVVEEAFTNAFLERKE